MNTQKITLVSLIGRPLSGKDHQAKLLGQKYQGVAVISTGGLLRDEELLRRSGYSESEVQLINFQRNNGMSVRAGIVEHLAHQAILEQVAKGNTMIVLAGHPRSHGQLVDMRSWEDNLREKGSLDVTPVYIHLRIGERRANKRLAGRAEEEGRPDDQSRRALRTRHRVFRRNAVPMLGEIFVRGILGEPRLHSINGKRSVDEVTANIERILSPYLPPRRVMIEGQQARKER